MSFFVVYKNLVHSNHHFYGDGSVGVEHLAWRLIMNEEVVRILQEALTAVESLPGRLKAAVDLEEGEIVDGDDSKWYQVHGAFTSAQELYDQLKRALIEATATAYIVLEDLAEEDDTHVISVSSRFPRSISEICQSGLRFDFIVSDAGKVEVSDGHGKMLGAIEIDGQPWVYRLSSARQIFIFALSSRDGALCKQEELDGDEAYPSPSCCWAF